MCYQGVSLAPPAISFINVHSCTGLEIMLLYMDVSQMPSTKCYLQMAIHFL